MFITCQYLRLSRSLVKSVMLSSAENKVTLEKLVSILGLTDRQVNKWDMALFAHLFVLQSMVTSFLQYLDVDCHIEKTNSNK